MKSKITKKHLIYTAISGIIVFLILIIPLPYQYEAPGKVIQASSVVNVNGGFHDHPGKFYITTVLNEQANVLLYINYLLNPDSVMKPFQTGCNPDGKKIYQCADSVPDPAEIQTRESIYRAKLFALQKMGYKIPSRFEGVQVTEFLPGSKARGILQPGDIITEIDGLRVRHQIYLHRHVNSMIGKKRIFTVTFIRAGKQEHADIEAITDDGGRPSLGVFLQTYLQREELPVEIKIETSGYSGSSAGLPIFLEILHQLKKEDMAKGMKIAASGSLDEFGNIRSVYGVRFKVKGAEKLGIKYFICSKWNYEEAKDAAKSITVIPVTNINNAVEEVEKLRN
jgi:PDZ domain-containing protein